MARPIGDILKAQAEGKQISRDEIEKLRLWGNKIELQSAFVGGLQTGQSNINATNIEALSGEFVIPPSNASYFGSDWLAATWPQTLTNNTDTKLGAVFEDSRVNGLSAVVWYSESNYQFQLNPVFAQAQPRILHLFGNWHWENASSHYRELTHVWKRKADDTTYKSVIVYASDQAEWDASFGELIQLNDFDEDPNGMYFELHAKHILGSPQGLQFFVGFERKI